MIERIDKYGQFFEVEAVNGRSFLIDADDIDILSGKRWYVRTVKQFNHYVVREGSGFVTLHRILMGNPAGLQVDHRDSNGLNCRRYNQLRGSVVMHVNIRCPPPCITSA